MKIELKESISLAERSGWNLEYFENHYAVVSRGKDSVWKRKYNTLRQTIKSKCEIQSCDNYAVVMLWGVV